MEVVVLGMNSECPSPTLSSGGLPFTLLCDLGCNQASSTEIRVPEEKLVTHDPSLSLRLKPNVRRRG